MRRVCAPAAASRRDRAEAQVNYYHVVFNDRLLAISTNPGGIAGSGITGGTSILVNVGDVKTDGVDAAFTLRLGRAFTLYNATSYNLSKYQSDYRSTASGIGGATDTCIGGYLVLQRRPSCRPAASNCPARRNG
jgi:iron complex outermembrane receptor protein